MKTMKHVTHVALLLFVCAALILSAGPAAAQSGSYWHAEYFPNQDWAGSPVGTQDVYAYSLAFDWGSGAPMANMPADYWTARFTTTSYFYGNVYRFTVLADDEAWLQIDGVTYLDTRGQGMSGKTLSVDVPMYQGNHNLRVDFREFTGNAYVYVTYGIVGAPPPPSDGGSTTIPPELAGLPPLPTSATSVQTIYGDYTPCIEQGLHQSKCFVSNGAWDAPNLGSIEMEPQITIWGNCTADQVTTYLVTTPTPTAKAYKCSKTMAGQFPG
jgi:hypothetical protein